MQPPSETHQPADSAPPTFGASPPPPGSSRLHSRAPGASPGLQRLCVFPPQGLGSRLPFPSLELFPWPSASFRTQCRRHCLEPKQLPLKVRTSPSLHHLNSASHDPKVVCGLPALTTKLTAPREAGHRLALFVVFSGPGP